MLELDYNASVYSWAIGKLKNKNKGEPVSSPLSPTRCILVSTTIQIDVNILIGIIYLHFLG